VIFRHSLIVAVCLVSLAAYGQLRQPVFGPSLAEQRRAGQAVVSELLSMRPAESTEITGVMHIRAGRERREVPFAWRVVVHTDHWETIYQTMSMEDTPAEKLLIRHSFNKPNEYFYARAAIPFQPPGELKQLALPETFVPLAGSDFWLNELGLDFLHWPDQRRTGGEMRLGRPCHVIESRIDGDQPIVRVRSFIDQEELGVLIAEGYDRHDRKVKEFTLSGSSFKKVEGRWQLAEMKIRTIPARSETMLKFDLKTN
jgi:hypothetical protein